MKDLNDLDLEIQSLAAEIAALRNKQSQIRKNAMIKCAQCDHGMRVADIDLLDLQYYVRPSGCTDGDYHVHSEYNYICENCQVRNRFLFEMYYQIEWQHRKEHNPEGYFFSEWRGDFKSCRPLYKEQGPWIVNHHISDNLENYLSPQKWAQLCSYKSSPSKYA